MNSIDMKSLTRALDARLGGRTDADWSTMGSDDPLGSVRSQLQELERHLIDDTGIDFPVVAALLEHVFRAGGKRLRPGLVFLVSRLGSVGEQKLLDLAAAVETLHTATLVHDDLVDGALLRRGLPTLNVRWSSGATVLAGDWLFARAANFAADTGHVGVMKIFARTLSTLTDGELRQLFGRSGIPSQEEYEFRIYAKTASLFEAATEATGVLLELPPRQVAALATYGRSLGCAFQVIDDMLDFVGDPRRLGKPVGNDLRSGQVTLPAMLHLERYPQSAPWLVDGSDDGESDRGVLSEWPDDEELGRLVERVRSDAAALAGARARARGFAREAIRALEALPDGRARGQLTDIAHYAVNRDY